MNSTDALDAPAAGADVHATPGASAATDRTAPTRHVPHIDGLRALAVLAVIAYHLDERWLPGGFGGVDIFFAISGFVVSASVGTWNQGGFGRFIVWFYARRMQRIVPALLACLLLTTFASALFVPAAWLSTANETTGLYAFFGLSNWFLANHRESYFSPTIDFNPYTHTWSLGVEEQFYLLFPLLFFTWTRGGRWRAASMILFATAAVASIMWAWQLGRADPAASFYLITTRLFELAGGVLLYQILSRRTAAIETPARTRFAPAGAWASLALVVAGLLMSKPRDFPFPGALLPVLGTLGLLAFLHEMRGGALQRVLASRGVTYVGRISYSLYLWHWPVFVLFRWTCGLESAPTRSLATALTFALAAASFRFVEKPLRYSTRLRALPRVRVVALGIASVGGAWWLSTQITAARESLAIGTVTRHADDWYPHAVTTLPQVPGCRLDTHIAMAGTGSVAIYSRSGCPLPAEPVPTLFVIGDSHASAYLGLLTEHVLRSGATVVLYHNQNCTFASLQPEREQGACPAQGQAAIDDMLARGRTGDIVFLAALRLNRLSNQFAGVDEARARDGIGGEAARTRRATAEKTLIAQLAPLARHGMRMIADAPKPVFRAPPFRCADWFDRGNPICAAGLAMRRDDLQRYRAPVLDSLARVAQGVPPLLVWDPFPILCPDAVCVAIRDGKPLFFDGDHLSAYANRMLRDDFERIVREAHAKPDA